MKIAIVDPSRTVRRIVGETVARWALLGAAVRKW